MSDNQFNAAAGGKKAVHVKWAGKTIALGTFSSAEADEKCARAKALTRAWRSTMRPKPSREWVMLELERLQVRVVSGRLGRKGGEDGDEDDEDEDGGGSAGVAGGKPGDSAKKGGSGGSMGLGLGSGIPSGVDPALLRRDSLLSGSLSGRDSLLGNRRDSITGLLSAADMAGSHRSNSMGFSTDTLGDLMHRRSSSIGMSLLPDHDLNRRNSSMNLSGVLDLGGDMPPHRPLVGGGSAAAYEAARADHYHNLANKGSGGQERRASGLSLGGAMGGGMGMSVNPNQHYEMLKLHHMNLLNEIQETTLMMNLYQQQQLQQQQQMQHQNDLGGPSGSDLAMLLHQQNGGGRMGSLSGSASASNDMQSILRQQQQMMQVGSVGDTKTSGGKDDDVDARRAELNDQIARLQREAQQLQKADAAPSGKKRDSSGAGDSSNKRVKSDGNDGD